MPSLSKVSLSFIVLLILSMVLLCADSATALINSPPSKIHRFNPLLTRLSLSSSADDYTVTEVNEMNSLIVSLSLEPTDDSRRHRLASVFAKELDKTDCRRFSVLFDQVLAVVGDRVQLAATKKALEAQEERNQLDEQELQEKEERRDEENEDGDFMGMGKSPEERQLW
eukprot:CAMPEP_0202496884 /NCGR_PEP_ID=MMETSP1361-20130828/21277_1 /ASSEMBLY_ACC=CAM_ASM_000849 /TAXON_ID=210615 /ORGANISM="Staurosira complex sp., Strain CCMP2646" /LENGTH=168 /DNA_ID=CAMNT_0049128325 /DNA_START=105 /DNA_END=608 /DNA_ORIENTATION=-